MSEASYKIHASLRTRLSTLTRHFSVKLSRRNYRFNFSPFVVCPRFRKGSKYLHPRKFPVNLTIDPRRVWKLIKHQRPSRQTIKPISLGVPTLKRPIEKPFYLRAHERTLNHRVRHITGKISVAAGLADQYSDEISPSSTSHNRLHIPSIFKARSEFVFVFFPLPFSSNKNFNHDLRFCAFADEKNGAMRKNRIEFDCWRIPK